MKKIKKINYLNYMKYSYENINSAKKRIKALLKTKIIHKIKII